MYYFSLNNKYHTTHSYVRFLLRKVLYFTVPLMLIGIVGCKKVIKVPEPINTITTEKVFDKEANAISAVISVYSFMSFSQNSNYFSSGFMTIAGGMSGDELIQFGNPTNEFATNQLFSSTGSVYGAIWSPAFYNIYQVNAILEGLQVSDKLSDSLKKQLTGELKFLRAFNYFYLVNLFGGVPLVTTTSFSANSTLKRASVSEIYDLIIDDLKEAKGLLNSDYQPTNNERIRVNKWAAMALLCKGIPI